jgi:hypothetical protein
MNWTPLIRFAPVDHPHFNANAFCERANLVDVEKLWRGNPLTLDLRFVGTTKKLTPLESSEMLEMIIFQSFPASLYLCSEKHWTGRNGRRWTIALRKTVVVAFVEMACDRDVLERVAADLPADHWRVYQSVPEHREIGFVSAVELQLPDEVENLRALDIGRFAPIALADYFDPLAVVHESEKRIINAFGVDPPDAAKIEKIENRWFVNWLTNETDPDSAWRRRLAWMDDAAKS